MTKEQATAQPGHQAAFEDRVEDVLTLYAAGMMSKARAEETASACSTGWFRRADQAAFQLGREACDRHAPRCFGVPALDRAFRRGQKAAAARPGRKAGRTASLVHFSA